MYIYYKHNVLTHFDNCFKYVLIVMSIFFKGLVLIFQIFSSPPQVLKVRLNLQQAGTYHGVVACARSIYSTESMSSFYRGFRPSILCMIPYAGVECAVHQVRPANDQTPSIARQLLYCL